jgi:hypothetical protein
MIMLASQPMMPPTISQMMKFIEFPRLVGLLKCNGRRGPDAGRSVGKRRPWRHAQTPHRAGGTRR